MSFTVLEKQVMEDGINYLSSLDKNLSKFLKQFDVPVLPIEEDYFWSLTRSVIYQQISVKAAKKISDRYLKLFNKGSKMSPIDVIKIDIEKIQNVGISRQKSGYIKNIANAFDEGLVNETQLHKLSDKEIIDQLVKIKDGVLVKFCKNQRV